MRRLIPQFQWGRWGGAAIDEQRPDLDGFHIAVEWLGIHLEIAIATRPRR